MPEMLLQMVLRCAMAISARVRALEFDYQASSF